MRNFRDLSKEEMAELERLYPTTTDLELEKRFGISSYSIRKAVARPRGWKKDIHAVHKNKKPCSRITDEGVAWLIENYANNKNSDLVSALGVSETQIHRVARRYGLKKSDEFIKRIRKSICNQAVTVLRNHGIYDENGRMLRKRYKEYKEKGIPWQGFKPGENNRDRFGEEKFREAVEKVRVKRSESIRRDRARLAFGLPQKLKFKLNISDPKTVSRKINYRHSLRKRNYIVERGSDVAWYDEETERNLRVEKGAAAAGITILSDMLEDSEPEVKEVRVERPPRLFDTW